MSDTDQLRPLPNPEPKVVLRYRRYLDLLKIVFSLVLLGLTILEKILDLIG